MLLALRLNSDEIIFLLSLYIETFVLCTFAVHFLKICFYICMYIYVHVHTHVCTRVHGVETVLHRLIVCTKRIYDVFVLT